MPKKNSSANKSAGIIDPITGVRVEKGKVYNDAYALIGNSNYFGIGENILDSPQEGTSYAAEWEFSPTAIVATFLNHKYDPSSYPEGRQEYAVYRSVLLGKFKYSKKGDISGIAERFLDGSSYSDSAFGASGDPGQYPSLIPDNLWDFTSNSIFPIKFSSVADLRSQIRKNESNLTSLEIWTQGADRASIPSEFSKYFPVEFWQQPFSGQLA
jgi:hypothetical protein